MAAVAPMSPTEEIPKPAQLLTESHSVDNNDILSGHAGDYILGKTIGQGSFGKVKIGYHKTTNEKVAIKLVQKSKLKRDRQISRIVREVRFLKTLHHPHIVRIYDVFESKDMILIVMELASGGELFDYIVARNRLQPKEARRFFRQMLSALDYCHRNSIIHRDLKPENLLLDSENNIKIIDFGFSNIYDNDNLMDTFCGSPYYAAPEMLLGHKYFGPPVDVWSLGIILYTCLTGLLPFDGADVPSLCANISRGRYHIPDYLTDEERDLVARMLVLEPSKRATIQEIMHHPWVIRGYSVPPASYLPSRMPVLEPNAAVLERVIALGFHRDEIVSALAEYAASRGRSASLPDGGKSQMTVSPPPNAAACFYYLVYEQLERENRLPHPLSAANLKKMRGSSLSALSHLANSPGDATPPMSEDSATPIPAAHRPAIFTLIDNMRKSSAPGYIERGRADLEQQQQQQQQLQPHGSPGTTRRSNSPGSTGCLTGVAVAAPPIAEETQEELNSDTQDGSSQPLNCNAPVHSSSSRPPSSPSSSTPPFLSTSPTANAGASSGIRSALFGGRRHPTPNHIPPQIRHGQSNSSPAAGSSIPFHLLASNVAGEKHPSQLSGPPLTDQQIAAMLQQQQQPHQQQQQHHQSQQQSQHVPIPSSTSPTLPEITVDNSPPARRRFSLQMESLGLSPRPSRKIAAPVAPEEAKRSMQARPASPAPPSAASASTNSALKSANTFGGSLNSVYPSNGGHSSSSSSSSYKNKWFRRPSFASVSNTHSVHTTSSSATATAAAAANSVASNGSPTPSPTITSPNPSPPAHHGSSSSTKQKTRGIFSVKTTFAHNRTVVWKELIRVCESLGLLHVVLLDSFAMLVQTPDGQWACEVELVDIEQLDMTGIQFHRRRGNIWTHKKFADRIAAQVNP